eukprot:5085138-Pyramimonas_sp.AAC.1
MALASSQRELRSPCFPSHFIPDSTFRVRSSGRYPKVPSGLSVVDATNLTLVPSSIILITFVFVHDRIFKESFRLCELTIVS